MTRIAGVVALVAATIVVAPAGPADAATFDVTRFDDPVPDGCASGVDCSLREAVIDANATGGADVIDVPAGYYNLTQTGPLENSAVTGDLDITDDVTINGYGNVWVSASGLAADPDRVFHTMNGATVEFVDFQVQDGAAPTSEAYGGGILQENGSLTLTRVGVHDNSNPGAGAPNDADGGGIATRSGSLTLTDSAVQSNSTNDDGGGIAIESGDVTLTNVAIDANTVTGPGSGGGGSTEGANGGGLYLGSSVTGDFTNANFGGNAVLDTDEYSGGGGFFVAGTVTADGINASLNTAASFGGGGRIAESGSVTATKFNVHFNDAPASGGGLAVQGTLDATGGSISRNTAGGAAGLIIGANEGPASNVSLDDVVIEDNIADVAGGVYVFPGAEFSFSNQRIRANSATAGPVGGLYNAGTSTLFNADVNENTATGGAGGMRNDGTLEVTDASVSNNDARPGEGGGIYTTGTTTLNRVNVAGNQADVAGGGIIVDGGTLNATDLAVTGNGGALIGGGGIAELNDAPDPSAITLNRATISGHSVTSFGGGATFSHEGYKRLTNVTVSGNEVTETGGFGGGGVAVVNNGTILDLEYSTIADNVAPVGGGVSVQESGSWQTRASLITDNGGGDCELSVSATSTSNDFNVVGDNTCGLGQPNDVNNAGPMLGTTLGPLADNGGWNGVMLTHALLTGNPAIDHADSPSCPGLDERGHVRPVGAACDTGAYEAAETPPPDPDYELTIDKTLVGAAKAGGEAHWHITISNTGTDPAPGRLTFADTLPDAVSFTSVAAPDWDCSNKGQTVTCFYDGDLDPGVVTKLDIVAAIDGEPGSDITNTAGVSTFGSVDPTFSTAPGEVSTPSVPVIPDPDDPSGGKPSGDATGEPPGTLPFTGFHLTEVALAAAAAVALGATITWRNRRRARA